MPRGTKAQDNETRVAANGYHYTKVPKRGWILTHRLLAEENLGRRLKKGERVTFKDGDRTNLTHENVEVKETKYSRDDRIKYLENKIKVYKEELAELRAEKRRRS